MKPDQQATQAPYITEKEAAILFSCSLRHFQRHMAPLCERYRSGRLVRYSRENVLLVIQSHKISLSPEFTL